MQAGDVRLGQVFSSDHVNLIPLFQRPYVWDKDENWIPLWLDIQSVARDVQNDRNGGVGSQTMPMLFLGAFVTHQRTSNPRRVASSYIVDGQQRLSTIQVVLAAIRSLADSRGEVRIAAQCTALLENRAEVVHEEHPTDRYKVWPLPQDRAAYVWAVRSPSETAGPHDASHRLVRARSWFEQEIAVWLDQPGSGDRCLEDLLIALRDRMQFVQINLGVLDHSQVIFEALNHRGVRLAAADLVKNRLFHAVEQQGEAARAEQLLLEHWLELDSGFWRETVTTGRIKRARVDLLIAYWLTTKIEDEVVVESLFTDFSRWMSRTSEQASGIIQELRVFADVYRKVLEAPPHTATGRLVAGLRATRTTTPWPVLLLLHVKRGVPVDQLERAAEAIDSFLVRRAVLSLTAKDYNRLFLLVLKRVIEASGESAGDEVVAVLSEQSADSRRWPRDSEFRSALSEKPLYETMTAAQLRSVLISLENHLQADGKGAREHLLSQQNKLLNIEHVMPQRWEQNWPLPIDSTEQEIQRRQRAVHLLGNLTIATEKLNPALGNKGWSEKAALLMQFSLLRLTTQSILSVPQGCDWSSEQWLADWDESRIYVRTAYLADLAVLLWRSPPNS